MNKQILVKLVLLSSTLSIFSAQAATFTDKASFESNLAVMKTIDFEGLATAGGHAGAVELNGNEFEAEFGVSLIGENMFVGIPDPSVSSNNNKNFYVVGFVPTSGRALFAFVNDCPVPAGALTVNFDTPQGGVGGYLIDAEGPSSVEAFDGVGGSGNSLGKVVIQNQRNNSHKFAGVVAEGIRSAVFTLGGCHVDGAALDDLVFGTVQPMAVTLSDFRANQGNDGTVSLEWETTHEDQNAQFDVWRIEKIGSVQAQGGFGLVTPYNLLDGFSSNSESVYYFLQDIDTQGKKSPIDFEKISEKQVYLIKLK